VRPVAAAAEQARRAREQPRAERHDQRAVAAQSEQAAESEHEGGEQPRREPGQQQLLDANRRRPARRRERVQRVDAEPDERVGELSHGDVRDQQPDGDARERDRRAGGVRARPAEREPVVADRGGDQECRPGGRRVDGGLLDQCGAHREQARRHHPARLAAAVSGDQAPDRRGGRHRGEQLGRCEDRVDRHRAREHCREQRRHAGRAIAGHELRDRRRGGDQRERRQRAETPDPERARDGPGLVQHHQEGRPVEPVGAVDRPAARAPRPSDEGEATLVDPERGRDVEQAKGERSEQGEREHEHRSPAFGFRLRERDGARASGRAHHGVRAPHALPPVGGQGVRRR
jgi:hypothetical protein